jgi:predicted  nucleic acid-binding Zn-ribbon protein
VGAYAPADPYYGALYTAAPTPQEEAEYLKNQAKAMQDEINAINERISELESAAKESK